LKTSLFDIQINGFAGVDFQHADLTAAQVRRAVDALGRHQTLRFFIALITDSIAALETKLANLERIRARDPVVASAVCGYHLEGPWLSPSAGYRGAHDPESMGPPDLRDWRRLQAAARGHIRLVTIAPELPGAPDFIARVTGEGVRVSLGHTAASETEITSAIAAGASLCTHLGNGVPAQLHRHHNVVQRLLARDELTAFFIADGIHLPPGVLRNFFRAKPPGRALLTTDAMAAADAPPGRYTLGPLELEVGTDRMVRMPGTEGFAGSAVTPPQAVSLAAGFLGLPAPQARELLAGGPAGLFGIDLPPLNPPHQHGP
jgi:N-acetylglucosamine-6-phosphate deacetylase